MNTVKILIILIILSAFSLENINGQEFLKIFSKLNTGDTSLSGGNSNVNYGILKPMVLGWLDNRLSTRLDLRGQNGIHFIADSKKYSDSINKLAFYNGFGSDSEIQTTLGIGIPVTFNGKWASLMGKPIVSTNGFYSHSTSTNKPSFYDNSFYRLAGNIFNFSANARYPSLSAPNR